MTGVRWFGVVLIALATAGAAHSAYPGKNGKIAFVRSGSIWMIDASGRNAKRLTTGENPAWSPDGSLIAFDRANKGVFVMTEEGTNVKQLTKGFETDPTWSPDGKRLVIVSSNPPPNADCTPTAPYSILYSVAADGTGLKNLTSVSEADNICSVPGGNEAPAYSPKGDRIAYLHSELVVHEIFDTEFGFYNTAGKRLGHTAYSGVGVPSWSPDASRLAWSAPYKGVRQLWVAEPTAKNARRLTGAKGGSFQPAWSPDGTKLVFSRKGGSPQGLLVLDVKRGTLTQLTKSIGDGQPDWQPAR